MKINYLGKPVASLDQRFTDRKWFEGKDARVHKSKRNARTKHNKRIVNFKNELKRTFALIVILGLVTGFIWLRLGGI